MNNTNRFEFQKTMLEKGADELQRHISRLDEILSKIKAGCITVWVALIGWAFSSNNTEMVSLGAIVIIGFWLLEGFFRGLQARYLAASAKLTEFLNDKTALDNSFELLEFPANVVYPMTFSESESTKFRMYWRGLSALSTSVFYLFLVFVNYLLWVF
jgi:hypothetical protein